MAKNSIDILPLECRHFKNVDIEAKNVDISSKKRVKKQVAQAAGNDTRQVAALSENLFYSVQVDQQST